MRGLAVFLSPGSRDCGQSRRCHDAVHGSGVRRTLRVPVKGWTPLGETNWGPLAQAPRVTIPNSRTDTTSGPKSREGLPATFFAFSLRIREQLPNLLETHTPVWQVALDGSEKEQLKRRSYASNRRPISKCGYAGRQRCSQCRKREDVPPQSDRHANLVASRPGSSDRARGCTHFFHVLERLRTRRFGRHCF
jgi:hypothetical protein